MTSNLYPHVDAANEYVRQVLAGDIPACKWVRLACKRHRDDLRRKKWRYEFDPARAEKVCKFVELMPHTKGKWAAKGERLRLEPWQSFLTCSVFGWVDKETGFRRFRSVTFLVPRKNGKSAWAAAIGNYMLCADGEYGAEVYSGATSEKQALEVFKPAYYMVRKSADFRNYYDLDLSGTHKNPQAIYVPETGAKFEPVIGRPGDGASPHCAIADEYHEHKTDDLVETMVTGMGARDQPLMLIITTAGSNLSGPCYQAQLDLQKVLEGSVQNDELFGLIYTIDKGDDWTDIKTLRKANPNMGVSVSEEFLAARLQEAVNNARKQTIFKTKHLNQWVGARDAYFNVEKWQSLTQTMELSDYRGYQAYLGLDLASKYDLAALEIVIPLGNGDYLEFNRYYLPEETVLADENDHYRGWVQSGHITQTDGALIDYEFIKRDILEVCSVLQVEELAYDPHQATMLITALMDKGVPVVETRQSVANLSEPMKMLDGLIRSGQVRHVDNPCMDWMMSNVVAYTNAKDEVYPRKEREEAKIDGPVALILAIGRAILGGPPDLGDAIDDPIRASV